LKLEIDCDGDKRCELHNPYGPAVEHADGDKEWYLTCVRTASDMYNPDWSV